MVSVIEPIANDQAENHTGTDLKSVAEELAEVRVIFLGH